MRVHLPVRAPFSSQSLIRGIQSGDVAIERDSRDCERSRVWGSDWRVGRSENHGLGGMLFGHRTDLRWGKCSDEPLELTLRSGGAVLRTGSTLDAGRCVTIELQNSDTSHLLLSSLLVEISSSPAIMSVLSDVYHFYISTLLYHTLSYPTLPPDTSSGSGRPVCSASSPQPYTPWAPSPRESPLPTSPLSPRTPHRSFRLP